MNCLGIAPPVSRRGEGPPASSYQHGTAANGGRQAGVRAGRLSEKRTPRLLSIPLHGWRVWRPSVLGSVRDEKPTCGE